jgi:purine nucleosidase
MSARSACTPSDGRRHARPHVLPMFQWLALLAIFSVLLQGKSIPVILDTDIGDDIDDALALALALQSPELRVLAITTVLHQGERRADLTYRILELYHRTDIPVGVGAEQPLLAASNNLPIKQTQALASDYHMPLDRRRNGLELLIETVMRSPEKVTLLAYGPATNVAIALRAEPRLAGKLERIVLMNGVFFRPGLEYNTFRDPEASQIVYTSGIPVTTVGLDVTTQCRLSAENLAQMESSSFENVKFLRKLIGLWQNGNAEQRPTLHDPLAVLVTFRGDLIDTVQGKVTVETKGSPGLSYGLTVFRPDASGSVSVAREVRAMDAVNLFVQRVMAAPRQGSTN